MERLALRRLSQAFRILSLFLILLNSVITVSASNPSQADDLIRMINSVDIEAVKKHVEFLSGLGTRATGYSGNDIAAQYIYDFFMNLSRTGAMKNVSFYEFPVVDCIDRGSSITVSGKKLTIYPLLPNMVVPSTTPPEGLTGKLIYVDGSYISDFDGKPVEGNIVIMGWEDGVNRDGWLNAVYLGARAVIFTPSRLHDNLAGFDDTPGYLAKVPLQFPRFYVEEATAEALLKFLGEEARIVSSQRWEKVVGRNVVGVVRGTLHPDKKVLLSSYYDSYSYAPSIAPGAQEACGVAALLELAKYLSENPPKYSAMFVAFGGHNQGIEGARRFIHDYYGSYNEAPKYPVEGGDNMLFHLNLDLSTGTDAVYLTLLSSFFGQYQWTGQEERWERSGRYFMGVYDNVNKQKPKGKTYDVQFTVWIPTGRSSLPSHDPQARSWKEFLYDSEPQLLINMGGYTFTTAYDPRSYLLSPFDTLEKMNFGNLKTQLEFIHICILKFLNEDDLLPWVGLFLPHSRVISWPYVSWTNITGRVAEWNTSAAWYTPVPGALVYVQGEGTARVTSFVWTRRFTFADETGAFWFEPINKAQSYSLSAWVIDPATGNIVYAPDYGQHKYAGSTISTRRDYGVEDIGFITVFKASTMAIFDVKTLTLGSVEQSVTYYPVTKFMEHYTQSEPLSSAQWRQGSILIEAFPPETTMELTWMFEIERYPWVVLINASSQEKSGSGYKPKIGTQLILPMTSLKYAGNLYWLNEERLKALTEHGLTLPESEYAKHLQSGILIEEAYSALAQQEYTRALGYANEAWKLSRENYMFARVSIEDSASTVPFLAVFLVPFTFLAEKLIFDLQDKKRLLSFLGIFAALTFAFYYFHPGFSVAANPYMIVVGFSTLILTMPLLVILAGYVSSLIKDLRLTHLGRHEVEVSRVGQVAQAFITGIEHMRKLKLRSTLTLLSIILMISGLTMSTSITTIRIPQTFAYPGQSIYNGVYIHRYKWGAGSGFGISGQMIEILSREYGGEALILPRAWKYTSYRSLDNPLQDIGFRTTYHGKVIITPVLWGLTPEEEKILGIFITYGRWFMETDRFAVILNERQAATLGINATKDLPVTVFVEGQPYTVIGVVRQELKYLRDLDGEEVTPIKFDVDVSPNPWDIHVSLDYSLIMQYEDVITLGGAPASVSLIFKNSSSILDAADRILGLYPEYDIFSCIGKSIRLHSERFVVNVYGVSYMTIPILIVTLSIFNTMLGNVYERKGQIGTYSTLGLSPLHIGFMFLAEAMVYAILGGISGYLFALGQGRITSLFLPDVALNYSFRWVIITVALTMAVTIISSIYPFVFASRLVTPSLERAWRIPTKPTGDMWEVPFPFKVAGYVEASAIIAYLVEFLKPHEIKDAPEFSVTDVRVTKGEMKDQAYMGLTIGVRLYPYEYGVVQKVDFYLVEEKREGQPERWTCNVALERFGGSISNWEKLNRHFLDLLRKQLLLWRTIPDTEKERYMKLSKEIVR